MVQEVVGSIPITRPRDSSGLYQIYPWVTVIVRFMNVSTDPQAIDEVLTRSVDTIYPDKDTFKAALESGKQLKIYVGIDPTADYVHLGHSTNYLVLERLQKLGHKIVVLVGDFTAMIGDPSDKTAMRQHLTQEQVKTNLQTFKDQIGKILDFESQDNPIEITFNADWLSKLTFADAVELASNFTVQQMIERDAFQKRLAAKKPLFVHEFFYPLMQGYDSVAMDVDVEIGGTDQTFNMMAGRTLLKRYKDKEKFVITTTLLVNPDTGEKLMSKSLGTGVSLKADPDEMFGGVMAIADAGMIQVFTDCTRLSMHDIAEIKGQLAGGTNPRDIKLRLAREIVTMYHTAEAAQAAENRWTAQFSEGALPEDIVDYQLQSEDNWIALLTNSGLAPSNSEARRLLEQGGVRLNQTKVELDSEFKVADGDVLQAGKRRFVKLKS